MTSSSSDPNDTQWLAYELHDGLLQWIFGAKMLAESALKELGSDSVPGTKLKEALQNLHLATQEGRTLIQFLESGGAASGSYDQPASGSLDSLVQSAIVRLATVSSEHHIASDFDSGLPSLAPSVRWNLFRIVEQAILNAIQHAGPCDIHVSLQVSDAAAGEASGLIASVVDNGVGFDPEQSYSNHFGLSSLRHRSEMIGADLKIHSKMGEGTRVEVVYPLP